MANLREHNDLDPILLQAEQNFFEKSEEEIIRIEQNRITQERIDENTIRLLRLQLLQAQEEISVANQSFKDFKLVTKQLNQAQEELSASLDSMRSLQEWQYIHRTSIISQLKLIVKTLARKLRNKAVWLIPLHGARRGKAFLKHFIQSKR